MGDIRTKENVRIHIVDKAVMPNANRTAAEYISQQIDLNSKERSFQMHCACMRYEL